MIDKYNGKTSSDAPGKSQPALEPSVSKPQIDKGGTNKGDLKYSANRDIREAISEAYASKYFTQDVNLISKIISEVCTHKYSADDFKTISNAIKEAGCKCRWWIGGLIAALTIFAIVAAIFVYTYAVNTSKSEEPNSSISQIAIPHDSHRSSLKAGGGDGDNIISLVIAAFSAFGALGVIVFAALQWKDTNKIKRAEFVTQIIRTLRFEKSMVLTAYTIDYNKPWYQKYFHNFNHDIDYSQPWYNEELQNTNRDIEFEIDKYLSYLSYICYLRKNRYIRKNEFEFFEYKVKSACRSTDVQIYLWNLYHFSKKCGTVCSFENLIEFGMRRGIFTRKDFKENDRDAYIKILHF